MLQVLLDRKVKRELRVPLAHRVHKVKQALRAQQGLLVRKVKRVPLGLLA